MGAGTTFRAARSLRSLRCRAIRLELSGPHGGSVEIVELVEIGSRIVNTFC